MKEYLVDYSIRGIVYQSYMTEIELYEVRYYGKLIACRKLSNPEIMEIAAHSFQIDYLSGGS